MANRRPLIVAIIFGIIAVVLVYAYIKSKEEEMTTRKVEYGKVVLANEKIGVRTQIKEDMVREEEWPLEFIPEPAYNELDEVIGKITSEAIQPDVPLLPDQFKEAAQIAELAFQLNDQERAVTIGVTEIKAVGGNVKPGDHVDILATFTDNKEVGAPTTITVLRDIRVVAVGKDIGVDIEETPGAAMSKTVTVAVTPDEAEILTLVDENGDVRLSLRPPEERYAPLSYGTTMEDVVSYQETRDDKVKAAEKAEEERKAAEEEYMAALRERTGYKEPVKNEQGQIVLPPIEETGPPPIEVEVILGGKSEKVSLPQEETYGMYSVWPGSYGYSRIFPMSFYVGD